MAFYLLPNTIGNAATAVELIGSTVTAMGDKLDLISGPRNYLWRSTASSSGMAIGYQLTSDLTPTHVVLARADKMVTLAGARLTFTQRSSAPAWSGLSPSINPLTAASLVGIKSQDYVAAISPTQLRGFGVDFDSAGTEAFCFSKMYFSTAFEFSGEINLEQLPEWRPIAQDRSVEMFIPQKGNLPYEVEADIQITWKNNTKASITAFKALPQILNWPLFLYDESQTLWQHKLEHVIIAGWQETMVNQDIYDITIAFKRLRHYE